MRGWITAVVAASTVAVFGLTALAGGKGPAVGSTAPEWTLKDSSGKEHKLSDYRGKIVVMDFWATWCGPCKRAMPTIQKIHEEYKDKGVVVFGVNCWERDDAQKYMNDKKFTYGLLLKADDVATRYGVEGIPAFFIVDPTGKIAFSESGFGPNSEKEIRAALEKLLSKS